MIVLQHTKKGWHRCLKQNRTDRSSRDTLSIMEQSFATRGNRMHTNNFECFVLTREWTSLSCTQASREIPSFFFQQIMLTYMLWILPMTIIEYRRHHKNYLVYFRLVWDLSWSLFSDQPENLELKKIQNIYKWYLASILPCSFFFGLKRVLQTLPSLNPLWAEMCMILISLGNFLSCSTLYPDVFECGSW